MKEYDFIIVGSGPGGCVLANRLSENPKWNVLLIEAGTVETFFQNIPFAAPFQILTKYNWGYKAERQDDSGFGIINQQVAYPRGKGLGGSSIINGMLYTRGAKSDFDRWASFGNKGWSYDEILPYFKKSERARLKFYNKPHFHNQNGLLSVKNNLFQSPLAGVFVKGNKLKGLKEIDYNSDEHIGVAYLQANTLNGTRHSAYRAFIEPVLKRKNLHIMLNTRVTKVLINPITKDAYGVEFLREGKRESEKILSKKEVILSAGTFHSPQLLMLSGVGQRNELKRIKVNMIKHLPVGEIMYDHVSFPGLVFTTNLTFSFGNPFQVLREYIRGEGLLTTPLAVEALGYIKTNRSNRNDPNTPDVEIILVSSGPQVDGGIYYILGERVSQSLYNSVYGPLEGTQKMIFSLVIMLFHPKSVGKFEIRDGNPFSNPKLYTNYYRHSDDVETILDAIKYTLSLIETEPFKKINTKLHSIPFPNCAKFIFGSDDYWRCAIKTLPISLHHQVGTCRMGPTSDTMAIVSPELKVHGINKLRVADISVIPESTTSHTNAVSFMIGEKAAEMIKMVWK